MGMLWQDVKYGLRGLLKNPGFTAVVATILAIGTGATMAMLTVVDAVVLRPCPYEDAERLVWVCETNPGRTQRNMVSLPNFCDWRDQSQVFEHLIAASWHECTVQDAGRTEKGSVVAVSEGFFATLGVKPMVGRSFLPEEEKPGQEHVVILSASQWQHWFAGDPNVIGKPLVLDRNIYTVVGVLPGEFRWVFHRDSGGLWIPMALKPMDESRRGSRGADVVGRLKPGTSVGQAQAEMNVIADRLAQAYPSVLTGVEILGVPMDEAYRVCVGRTGDARVLVILLGIVGGVLLVACLHVASLLMVRSIARERDIAVRAALGAPRLCLIRQLSLESLLLAVLGGLLGLLLAHGGIHLLAVIRGYATTLVPWFVEPHLDGRSVLYVSALSLATCGVFGVLPAVSVSRVNLGRFLSAGRTPQAGPRFRRVRSALTIADLAVTFVLLIIAGLAANTYVHILRFDSGMDAKRVLTMDIDLDTDAPPYSEPERRTFFFGQVLAQVQRLPGVQGATLCSATPAARGYNSSIFRAEGRRAAEDQMIIRRTTISPDYFPVLQIRLLKGRYFTAQETATGAGVAILNESLAERLWPGQDPLGQYITQMTNAPKPVSREIVGVVADVRHFFKFFLADIPVELRQKFVGAFPDDVVYVPGYENALMIRTVNKPAETTAAIHRTILAIDKEVVPSDVSLLEDRIAELFWQQRFHTLFLLAFGGVALVLSSIGIYSALAYGVLHRTHEIGIRIALGATKTDVLKAILGEGLRLTLIGIVIGLAAALLVTRVAASLLQDVSPTDPLTFACVSLLLAGVALLASYIPARRAARINPMTALRRE